jgi:hypothetical protein
LLTLSGNDTTAHYQQVLRTVKYNNTSGGPRVTFASVNVVASDGLAASNTAAASINVSVPPVLDLNGATSGTGFATIWTNAGAVNIADTSNASVTDGQAANLTLMNVTIASFHAGDTLSADTAGTSIVASYNGSGLLTLSGNDTVAHYQQVLRTVKYNNASGNPGVSSVSVNFVTTDGFAASNTAVATISISVGFSSTVAARKLFYKGSARYDTTGNPQTPLPFSDDNAIATDKSAYIANNAAATFANISSYSNGINGIMVDLAGSHGSLTASDFIFKSGNNNTPGTWTTFTGTTTVTTRAGAGTTGSDRVELIWANNTFSKTWLEVIVKGNDTLGGHNTNTGLAASDVFYFGNAKGDTGSGDTTSTAPVSSADVTQVQTHQNTLGANIPLTNIFDMNKDGLASSADITVIQTNQTTASTALKKIVLPIGSAGALPGALPSASPSTSTGDSVNGAAATATGDDGLTSALGMATVSSSTPEVPRWLANRLNHLDLNAGPIANFFQRLADSQDPRAHDSLAKIDEVADWLELDDELLDALVAS